MYTVLFYKKRILKIAPDLIYSRREDQLGELANLASVAVARGNERRELPWLLADASKLLILYYILYPVLIDFEYYFYPEPFYMIAPIANNNYRS